jgi:Flp pilus assembly protein TadG
VVVAGATPHPFVGHDGPFGNNRSRTIVPICEQGAVRPAATATADRGRGQVWGVRRRSAGDDAGASAVEFALVVPILVLLVFGIIDFGGIFAQQLALNNGVRQGTRQAVVSGATTTQSCAAIVSTVQGNSGPALALNTPAIKVKATLVDSTTGNLVTASCAGGAFVTTSSDTSTRPCVGSLSGSGVMNSLKVEVQYQSSYLIPLPIPFPAPVLRAQSVYRCEFTA